MKAILNHLVKISVQSMYQKTMKHEIVHYFYYWWAKLGTSCGSFLQTLKKLSVTFYFIKSVSLAKPYLFKLKMLHFAEKNSK